MTNLKPTSEPSVADSAELLAETSAEAGRKPRAGWRMRNPRGSRALRLTSSNPSSTSDMVSRMRS